MSERVPDNISSTSDAPPPDPSGPETAPTVKSPESVVDMEAEDVIEPTAPAPQVAAQSSASAAPVAESMVISSSDDANGRRFQLEEQELIIGGGLNADLYAELLLIYLVQQKRIEAKYCFMRAVEKYDDKTLRNIWKTGQHIYQYDFASALKEARSLNLNERLHHYVIELKNRLLSKQLKLIAKCYSSIESEQVANLLALEKDPEELRTIISACGWTIEPDGFVAPTETPKLQETAENLVNTLYGAMETIKKAAATPAEMDEKNRENYVEKLKQIVSFSDFIDNF